MHISFNMKKQLLSIALFISVASIAQKQIPIQKIANTISAKSLKKKLKVIAGADMEGRETATEGQRKAANYIVAHFKKLGLEPGAQNGEFQMKYPVFKDSLETGILQINNKNLALGQDWELSPNSYYDSTWLDKNIVYAGYGSTDSTHNDFHNLDVKGKWVLVLEGSDPELNTNKPLQRINAMKTFYAKAKGAQGIIFISPNLSNEKKEVRISNMYVKKSTGKSFPILYLRKELAATLLNVKDTSFATLAQMNKKEYPVDLSFSSKTKLIQLESSNVIGVLPGTDKKGEYVFVTAHYDHLGKDGKTIYYGADDDGSGTVSVLQMAEAFTKAKKKGFAPRRTIIFMTVSGEEKGLWGSAYYSEHPTVSMDSISADLNIDMIGRTDTERKTADSLNYIYVIGHDKLSSDLQTINEQANNTYTHLTLDYKFDDPNDPNKIYYRSDHYNFAKKGVPVLFFYDGMLLADYHQPTDTVDKINFDLMSTRAKMIFYTAWDIANRDNLLKRDIPLK